MEHVYFRICELGNSLFGDVRDVVRDLILPC